MFRVHIGAANVINKTFYEVLQSWLQSIIPIFTIPNFFSVLPLCSAAFFRLVVAAVFYSEMIPGES